MTDFAGLVREAADRLAAQHVGVVVAAVSGEAVEIHGAGRTGGDRDGVPGADTIFEIGSVTKAFTALTLARLAVAGTVDLDEPLAGLLPEGSRVPSRDGEEITPRRLATHTSGLPRLPKGMLLKALLRPSAPDPYAGCTAEFLLKGLAGTRLGATPGRRFRYSNLGAGLLGLALAHRTGTSYEELVAKEICAPLGMADTGITVEGDRSARLARGHDRRRRPVPAWHLADLAGAGGLRSTAADMVAFVRAQLDDAGELAEAVRLTRATEHRISPFSWTHLGWMGQRLHERQGGHLQIWHNGMTGGFSSFTGFDPEKGVAVVMLSNVNRSLDRPAFDLLRTLQEQRA
ncbi:serine hydrolase domain-containing protein [Planobispora takensis]|uniref:serine hydrolase domain-containing protein n=1 Tax=Planobispora takensis TaxID=1367882 RepID=UPI0019418CD0|nr:serine hydrolase domain-containing protein [Planobispora takensis]